MSNKPDWKDAPEWANWLAQDKDGTWYWYEQEPRQGNSGFIYTTGFVLSHESHMATWRKTLERRPESK
jgi:hypothetical protein